VIEIVVEFIVESLDILERRNDLLQIVVLKSHVNNKPTMDGGGILSSPAPCQKLGNTPGPLIVGMENETCTIAHAPLSHQQYRPHWPR
jgi:hypothetical protein